MHQRMRMTLTTKQMKILSTCVTRSPKTVSFDSFRIWCVRVPDGCIPWILKRRYVIPSTIVTNALADTLASTPTNNPSTILTNALASTPLKKPNNTLVSTPTTILTNTPTNTPVTLALPYSTLHVIHLSHNSPCR